MKKYRFLMVFLIIGGLIIPFNTLAANKKKKIKIFKVIPKVVRQNDTKTLKIKGKRFLEAAKVDLGEGITVTTIRVTNKKIKGKAVVDLDAKIGKRTVVVTNPDGKKGKKKRALKVKKCKKDCEAMNPVEGDVIALHDKNSQKYNSDCLNVQCHKGILKETSLDSSIKTAHLKMLPFVPGYSATTGVTNEDCSYCHNKGVDIISHSAGNLRRDVDVMKCVACHGPSGPGKQFYQK